MHQTKQWRLPATVAGATLGLVVALPDIPASARRLLGSDFAEALAGFATLALALLSLWLLLASFLVAVAARTGTGVALARRLAPAWLAVTLSAGALLLAPAAQASPADLDGLPLPDRAPAVATAILPAAEPAPAPATSAPSSTTVVVQAGDCLWDLARAHASPTASDGDIARITAAWHRANHDAIGPDADTVFPGQVLTVPAEAGPADGPVAP